MIARQVGAAWVALLLLPLAAQAPPAPAVSAVGITVRDLEQSTRFYTDVLRCRLTARGVPGGAPSRLQLGAETLELHAPLRPGRAIPADSQSNDGWFQHVAIVVRDMDAAYAELLRHDVRAISAGPQTLPAWNPAAGGIRAFYFADPDGHALELIWFPPGKGDPRWQAPGPGLFLGIDHTAVAVTDTAASLRFWRDGLGLAVVGRSENHGPEQERLNAVGGARLVITTLRGRAGPGVELLEYVAPRTGRAMPADTTPADLWHWTITLRTEGSVARRLVDPDGHRVQLAP